MATRNRAPVARKPVGSEPSAPSATPASGDAPPSAPTSSSGAESDRWSTLMYFGLLVVLLSTGLAIFGSEARRPDLMYIGLAIAAVSGGFAMWANSHVSYRKLTIAELEAERREEYEPYQNPMLPTRTTGASY